MYCLAQAWEACDIWWDGVLFQWPSLFWPLKDISIVLQVVDWGLLSSTCSWTWCQLSSKDYFCFLNFLWQSYGNLTQQYNDFLMKFSSPTCIRWKFRRKILRNFFEKNFPEVFGINCHVEIYVFFVLFPLKPSLVKEKYDTIWDFILQGLGSCHTRQPAGLVSKDFSLNTTHPPSSLFVVWFEYQPQCQAPVERVFSAANWQSAGRCRLAFERLSHEVYTRYHPHALRKSAWLATCFACASLHAWAGSMRIGATVPRRGLKPSLFLRKFRKIFEHFHENFWIINFRKFMNAKSVLCVNILGGGHFSPPRNIPPPNVGLPTVDLAPKVPYKGDLWGQGVFSFKN